MDATSDGGVGLLLLGGADQEAPASHGFLLALGVLGGDGLVNLMAIEQKRGRVVLCLVGGMEEHKGDGIRHVCFTVVRSHGLSRLSSLVGQVWAVQTVFDRPSPRPKQDILKFRISNFVS